MHTSGHLYLADLLCKLWMSRQSQEELTGAPGMPLPPVMENGIFVFVGNSMQHISHTFCNSVSGFHRREYRNIYEHVCIFGKENLSVKNFSILHFTKIKVSL